MLFLVTALDCEARPLISHFELKLSGSHGRAQFFRNANTALVITGTGSTKSAIGTTALGLSEGIQAPSAWINIGICGHADLPVGTALLANKISSDASKEGFYPQCPWDHKWRGCALRTLSEPSFEYEENVAFDMEANGYYQAALRFASSECIHCLKIVSDNKEHPATRKMDKEAISQLVESQLANIEKFSSTILESVVAYKQPPWLDDLLRNAKDILRLTSTESVNLKKALGQWERLSDDLNELAAKELIENQPKKEVFRLLEANIQKLASNRLK